MISVLHQLFGFCFLLVLTCCCFLGCFKRAMRRKQTQRQKLGRKGRNKRWWQKLKICKRKSKKFQVMCKKIDEEPIQNDRQSWLCQKYSDASLAWEMYWTKKTNKRQAEYEKVSQYYFLNLN